MRKKSIETLNLSNFCRLALISNIFLINICHMASHKENSTFYVVTFRDPEQNKTVTLKAQSIGDSSLGLSFIKIADFIFDTKSKLIKPSEEQMAKNLNLLKAFTFPFITLFLLRRWAWNIKDLALNGIVQIWFCSLKSPINRQNF